jgi:hypothetical protein
MRLISRLRAVILTLSVALGCHNSVGPAGRAGVALESAVASRVLDEVRISIKFTVENRGDSSVQYWPCRSGIERAVGSDWRFVWGPLCTNDEPTALLPGAAHQDSMLVRLRREPGQPTWEYGPIDGTYRLSVTIKDRHGTVLPIADRISSSFNLVDPIEE